MTEYYQKSNQILKKFARRALWMNNPESMEFKMYFMEMITEIRQLSGREFNADITIDDIKRIIILLTEKYKNIKNISIDQIYKIIDTLNSTSKFSDLLAIASALSIILSPLSTILFGPLPYIFLKTFAPDRLKCVMIMLTGGILATELYSIDKNIIKDEINKKNNYKYLKFIIQILLINILIITFLFYLKIKINFQNLLIISNIIIIPNLVLICFYFLYNKQKKKNIKLIQDNEYFKFVIKRNENFPDSFNFDLEETKFIFNTEYFLTYWNIEKTTNSKILTNKRIWLEKWSDNIEKNFNFNLLKDYDKFSIYLKKYPLYGNKEKLILTYIELVLWEPFFPLYNINLNDIPKKEKIIPENKLLEISKLFYLNLTPKIIQKTFYNYLNSLNIYNIFGNLINIFKNNLLQNFNFFEIQNKNGIISGISETIIQVNNYKIENLKEEKFLGGGSVVLGNNSKYFEKLASSDSEYILYQLAKFLTSIDIILENKKDFIKNKIIIIELLKSGRDNLIEIYNKTQINNEEIKKSINYYEIAIKRLEKIL